MKDFLHGLGTIMICLGLVKLAIGLVLMLRNEDEKE
jgi:hypothetical protein